MSNNIKDNQIISIVGATATGKTAAALALAKRLISERIVDTVHLLSADSRQVYRGLENLTGADLPKDFLTSKSSRFNYQFFTNPAENIFLHGVSIIDPDQEWSVAHFEKLFTQIKARLGDQEVLLVVGGTGFYQQQVVNSALTLRIPQNLNLRQKLATLSVTELQAQLKNLDKEKLESMNQSDSNNPRRLVRAIEVTQFQLKHTVETGKAMIEAGHKIFYLELPRATREEKIKQRVLKRFALAKAEVANQLQRQTHDSLATTSIGFTELEKFIHGKIDQTTCLANWQLEEIQYAKRQDTWWKKHKDLIKINAAQPKQIADKILQTCYI